MLTYKKVLHHVIKLHIQIYRGPNENFGLNIRTNSINFNGRYLFSRVTPNNEIKYG
jgi:hypothetical protein